MVYILKGNTLQQNSFNPSSDNLEILIIWHLRRVVPRLDILLTTTYGMHSMTLTWVIRILHC